MAEPLEIGFRAVPFDLAFHPSERLVATGLVSGRVLLHRYGSSNADCDEPGTPAMVAEKVWSVRAHSESCRGLRFATGAGGKQLLLSVSPDHCIVATSVETGQVVAKLESAHEEPISRIVNLSDTTIATGDDEGTVKVWDTRHNACCGTLDAHTDFVSDMEFVSDTSQLLSVSGDGTLAVCNLKKMSVDVRSEFSEDELLSVVRVKNGKKVVCGSQGGVLLLYSWGQFADCSDRFVGHPNSVDAMVKWDEQTLITGSSDGLIRVVTILPNKMIGVVGEHAEEFPVERLAFSHDKSLLGSLSHDKTLKLWDMAELMSSNEDDVQQDVEMREDEEEDEATAAARERRRKGKGIAKSSSNFFADLV